MGEVTIEMPEKKWQDMDEKELYRYYSPSMWNPIMTPDCVIQQHIEKIEQESTKSYSSVPCERNIRYGKSAREVVDIFGESALPKDSPVYCFIHGGLWMQMSHNQYAIEASEWYEDGVIFCLLEYELAPKATVTEIAAQVRKGVRLLIDRFKARGSRGLYLAGHSAGAQLVGLILSDAEIMASGFIKGALCVSMIADLEPLVHTSYNDILKLSVGEAKRLSPCHHADAIVKNCVKHGVPVSVVVGEFESPEIVRQCCEFHEAMQSRHLASQFEIIVDIDHFDMVWEARKKISKMIRQPT